MRRLLISTGGPYEARFGYSRAVWAGEDVFVSGTTDAGPDGRSLHPDDPAGQARTIFQIIERALADAECTLGDVVRTRMYVTDPAHIAVVAGVHGEVFGEIRPASTALVISALVDPTLLVEIEAQARKNSSV
jgi:enamine deaminase RidA (YjgF/YER057c/UK114 family)